MPAVHMVERKGRGTREKDVWETFGLVCILTMINGFTEMQKIHANFNVLTFALIFKCINGDKTNNNGPTIKLPN